MKQKKIPPLRDLPIPTRKVRTILAYRIVLPIHIIKMGVVYPVKVGDFWEKLPQFQMKSLPISPEVDPETLGAPFQIREQGGGGEIPTQKFGFFPFFLEKKKGENL